MDKNISYKRYQRQVILKNFGEQGQQKLSDARVLAIGAGGLGCPALQYLAAAGAGTIGIVDNDVVVLSNLHRQVLYSEEDIGTFKSETAAKALSRMNPDIKIISYRERLTAQNALGIMDEYDIIIDATDNFSSRYMINDACVLLGKPLVYGAVSEYEGQVAIFNYINGSEAPVNYRDLFPHPPLEKEVMNCEEAGVLGVLPGIIGVMQANETIKLLTGIGKPLINRLLTYNSLDNRVYEIELSARAETRGLVPADKDAFEKTDYEWLCGSAQHANEIDYNYFDQLLAAGNVTVIDVRNPGEMPEIDDFDYYKLPLSELTESSFPAGSDTVVVFCQSGKRSLHAVRQFAAIFGDSKKIFSLRGGIIQWKQQHSKKLS
jgi:molybdopterin/thiamine biosynthesis adenylyltransferase/rhodanese-related sulfurtransferase